MKRIPDVKFKCGEDDDGYRVTLRLKYYAEYAKHQKVPASAGGVENDRV